jgi:ABC-type lipoprotein release transport system permease subunit
MLLLIKIALRNLIRQKRRNVLLGIALAFGIMVLTVFNSFSKGITDTLLNRLIVYISGHIKVNSIEQGRYMAPIIRDREVAIEKVKNAITGIKRIEEEVATFGRGIGNGKGDYMFIVGLNIKENDEDFTSNFKIIKGDIKDYFAKKYSNPLILSENKAKALQVDIYDQVRIRLENVNGQNETAILTVVAIVQSQNMFMDYATFTPIEDLKKIMGYKEHETGALEIILDNPKTANEKANLIHQALQPGIAHILVNVNSQNLCLLPLIKNVSANVAKEYIKDIDKLKIKKLEGAIISAQLAKQQHLKIGSQIEIVFQEKFKAKKTKLSLKIAAINTYADSIPPTIIFLNAKEFFKIYNYYLPQEKKSEHALNLLVQAKGFWPLIAKEWNLLKRTHTTEEFNKKLKDAMKSTRVQATVDVASMYETSTMIIKTEYVFKLVTLLAAAIIFFIIMIGVLNSLRMTVIERTKEIGTMRAIGMQRNEVKWSFMLETVLLTIFSWIFGVLLGLLIMKLLTLKQFGYDNPLNMIMVDRRINFMTTWANVLGSLALALCFTTITAIFPARKAANLKPAEAFRHVT